MKIFALVASLLLVTSCAHDAQQAFSIDINGTWEGQLEGFMGGPPMNLIYNFKVDEESLTVQRKK